MANSDGQVRIDIITNAKDVLKDMDSVNKVFDKNTDTMKKASSATSAYEQVVQDNIRVLKESALGGNSNTEAFKKLAAQTREYQDALNKANNEVNKALGQNNQQAGQINKLAGAVKGLVGAYLGLQAIRFVKNYSIEAVQAFRQQDIAIKQLNQTLMNAGVYTKQYSDELQQLASEIQRYSNYGDEAVIKAQALAQSYIGNTRLTKELTRATVDFASATGMDLEQAFTLVGKSIGSQTNALGRYGVELQKGMTEAQKMEAIQKQLGARYTGTAKQMADSSIQLKNALGDLSEAFGHILNPAVQKTQNVLTGAVVRFTELINKIRILRSDINSLDLQESQTRYKQTLTLLNRLDEKRKKQGFLSGPGQGKYYQAVKDLTAVEAHMDSIYKKQRELAKQSKTTGNLRINDDFGISSVSGVGASTSASVQRAKDQYEKLQEAAAKAKREIELAAIAHGTSSVEVQNAFTKYQQLNGQLQEISKLFDVEKVKTEEKKGSYQQLSDRVSTLTQKLRDLAAENQIGSADWNTYKTQLQSAQAELDNVNKSLENNGIKIENVSKSISSSISSGLVNALRNGGNAFDAFSSLATTALQKILDKLIEMSFVTPVLNALTGGFGGSLFSLFGFKDGAAFKNGNVIPFAKGGVVNKPTLFPMANGGTGVMGEAGAEAVMPLKRMSNGKLGVEAQGTGGQVVNIYNYSGASIETRKRDDNNLDVFIRRVNDALSNERTSSGFRSAYARENNKGIQAV